MPKLLRLFILSVSLASACVGGSVAFAQPADPTPITYVKQQDPRFLAPARFKGYAQGSEPAAPFQFEGAALFNTTTKALRLYTGTAWVDLDTAGSGSSGWTDAGTVVRLTTITDNVGIGTVTPGASKLYVSGTTTLGGPSFVGAAGTDVADVTGLVRAGRLAADPGGINGYWFYNTASNKFRCYENGAWTNCVGSGGVTGSGTATRIAFWDTASSISSDANLYWDDPNNRLGVGTTTPGFTVTAVGDFAVTTTSHRFISNRWVNLSSAAAMTIEATSNDIVFQTGAPTERARIDVNGNFIVDTNTLYVDAVNNRVGVTNAAPASSFQIGANPDGLTTATDGFSLRSSSASNFAAVFEQANASSTREAFVAGHMTSTATTPVFTVFRGNGTTDAFNVRVWQTFAGGHSQFGSATADPSSPANGMMVYNSTSNKFRCYENSAWVNCVGTGVSGSGTATRVAFWDTSSSISSDSSFYWDNTNKGMAVRVSSVESGVQLQLNTTNTDSANVLFSTSSTSRVYFGASNNTGGLIAGSTAGDAVWRVETKKILVSADSGATAHIVMDTTGRFGLTSGVSPAARLTVGTAPDGITASIDGGSLRSNNASNRGWVFEQASTSNGNAAVVIGHMSSTATTPVFQVYGGNGSTDAFSAVRFGVYSGGYMTTSGVAGNPASPVDGDFWYNTTQKSWRFRSTAGTEGLVGLLFQNTADSSAVVNTTTETNFDQSFTLPANSLTVGKRVRVHACGKYSTTGTPTFVLRLKAGSVTLVDSGNITASNNATNFRWCFHSGFAVRTTGGSGTVMASGDFVVDSTSAALGDSSTVTISTTATEAVQVSFQWGTADAANTATLQDISVEALD